jgi:hypothetical protein
MGERVGIASGHPVQNTTATAEKQNNRLVKKRADFVRTVIGFDSS